MATNTAINELLTPGETARILNVHLNTLRRWSDQGLIQTYRIGPRGDRRFSKLEITYFLNELHKNKGDARKVKVS